MENLSKNEPRREQTPFRSIALAFSGGGFRAASFALGTLSYLNELTLEAGTPLLKNVSFISSASGGTITNAMYAQHNAANQPFGTFYGKLFTILNGTVLLDYVFKILNDDSQWESRPDKKRNMINAFALAYDYYLFEGALLGELYSGNSASHLEEVCFNATEFYRGLLFRQNIKMKFDKGFREDRKFRYGNFAINLGWSIARKLKLSDLLAASSCFPAGFEPIMFPNDFTYNNAITADQNNKSLTGEELLSDLYVRLKEMNRGELVRLYGEEAVERVMAQLPQHPTPEEINDAFKSVDIDHAFLFGMMDGGITDNQALESILDAQERRLAADGTSFAPFDLMLIGDVGSDLMDPYVPPKDESAYTGVKGITLNTLLVVLTFLSAIGLAAVFAGFTANAHGFGAKLSILSGSATLLLSGLLLCILVVIRSYIKGNIHKLGGLDLDKNFSPEIVSNLFKHFGATPVGVIYRMLKERFSSVLLLNNDVFLKRIRFLLYNAAYNSKRYTYRLKTNHLYDLSFSNDSARDSIPGTTPSREMQVVAQAGFEMGTTLWFDTKSQENDSNAALIACGQFTTCYNLLKYIYRLRNSPIKGKPSYYSTLPEKYRKLIDHLDASLKQDFNKFNTDPFWMYNQYGTSLGLPGFKIVKIANFKFPKEFEGLR
ncbi:Predicted acylesterase/phospholipase RssA, contains patatin domain [Parapedobacter luteus]|uniref:Predicted acylesterase/phospholipase RssA, contains patatin domain n=1 Tax=Parapedobacter luteus TaxID=623280 RepID=A0A1T5DC54_9SPHI|nr:patatin-like phospholipase family protein [Parapedobacter luteus]SKB69265.1 Predicted acylesterase/phospholipase RssA, contains patatin domain [Parapedobacter luteus]